jgi:hypothetical protein
LIIQGLEFLGFPIGIFSELGNSFEKSQNSGAPKETLYKKK